jgi:hypothetical protein
MWLKRRCGSKEDVAQKKMWLKRRCGLKEGNSYDY